MAVLFWGYKLPTDVFTVPLFGYIVPSVVVFTIFTNTLTCIVLLKRHMRNPTNIILASIALLDMFTGISVLPFCIYYYTFGYYKEYVPYHLCWITYLGQHVVHRILHTASIWLTVVLALQRYICVCHPQVANRWCTIPKTISCIIAICLLALLVQIAIYIWIEFTPHTLGSLLDPTKNISSCETTFKFAQHNSYISWYQCKLWLHAIFEQLIPSFTLLILTSLLIRTIRQAARRRQMLLSQNRTSESRNLGESNRTTMLLVMVVGVFLAVELPAGVISIIDVIDYSYYLAMLSWGTVDKLLTFTRFCIFLSFPFNLCIYCGMSRKFRETFKRLFNRMPHVLSTGQ